HQPKEKTPRYPKQFAPTFVSAVKIGLCEMQQHDDHDGARAVSVQAAQKRTAGYFFDNVGDGCVRARRGGDVIEREKNPGDRLRNKKKQQDRAENVGPARTTWNRFVQRLVQ